MSGKLRWVVIILVVLFVVVQFVARPAKTNPEIDSTRTVEASTHLTPEVAAIFERSCNDCHSNRTRWPWYSHVA
ncbi:MAG TPA: heme-binding domain-containing protein, partial [Pyrinomonadaceae bacterium]|nr:heme-binding domain-containing protein [Pyrinomonadaceae bacterium]